MLVDLVLVAVDQIRLGMGDQLLGNQIQRVRGDLVVAVHEDDEIPLGALERAVRRLGDMPVRGPCDDLDAPVTLGVLGEHSRHVGLGRCVVGDAELPVGVELRAHRVDGAAEPAFRRVVDRHDDREQRRRSQLADPARDGRAIRLMQRVELLHPLGVVRLAIGEPLSHQPILDSLDAVPTKLCGHPRDGARQAPGLAHQAPAVQRDEAEPQPELAHLLHVELPQAKPPRPAERVEAQRPRRGRKLDERPDVPGVGRREPDAPAFATIVTVDVENRRTPARTLDLYFEVEPDPARREEAAAWDQLDGRGAADGLPGAASRRDDLPARPRAEAESAAVQRPPRDVHLKQAGPGSPELAAVCRPGHAPPRRRDGRRAAAGRRTGRQARNSRRRHGRTRAGAIVRGSRR